MKRFFSSTPLSADLAALLLRLIVGGTLCFYHGIDKINHYKLYLSYSTNIIGIGTQLSYNLIIFAELVCAFFVCIGLLTRLFVLPILINFSVAVFIAHSADTFQVKELAFLFLVLTLPILVLGSGRYSVDRLLKK